ncbi:MAG: alpha-amylase family glycosyl hydrolase [Planctomycetota bacterium]
MNCFKHSHIQPILLGIISLSVITSAPVSAGGCQAAEQWPPVPPLKVAPDRETGPVPPSVAVEPIRAGRWQCTFRFQPPAAARSVALAGTFNGWNRTATPLKGPDAEGYWSVTIDLGAGKHLYKFVVDGQRWFPDPKNTDNEDDGHNGHNSVLRLGRRAIMSESTGRGGDGEINADALEHRPNDPRFFQPLAADLVLVRLQTLAHDVARVQLAIRGAGLTEMHLVHQDSLTALYEAQARLPKPDDGRVHTVHYAFVLDDGGQPASAPHTYARSFTNENIFDTPDWAKNAIWYQLMPDRFRNGDPANDPPHTRVWTSHWETRSPWESPDENHFRHFDLTSRYYGGDLAGLEEKLPYLRDLGVTALYLNPVFKADSHHKYDATNYMHIDDHLGTLGDYEKVAAEEDLLDPSTWQWSKSDRQFLRFIAKAHELGLRVIIDGVFNHVGRPHPAFQDVLANGQNSRFADWFDVTSWEPFEYSGWGGFGELPEFKKSATGLASEMLKQHIFNVTRRWMDPNGDSDPSDGIDGWRLDVPNEIPMPFWVEWRAVVKSTNPQAYITGEIWDQAAMWLDGKHFDAVMNYPFARAVVAWIMDRDQKISVSEFDRRLKELRLSYPVPATLVMQNLMNSHDTDRLVSMALNPDRAYDHANRLQDNGPDYNTSKPAAEAYARARLVALLQMTYVGAPMVYYGDEAGMWGADDPGCRKPMLWDDLESYENPAENHVMKDHREFYRRAIALRRAHPALRTGLFQTLLTDDRADVWAFLRWDRDEQLIVVLNASDQPRDVTITLPSHSPNIWTGVFGAEGHYPETDRTLSVKVPAISGVVLHAATPK